LAVRREFADHLTFGHCLSHKGSFGLEVSE